MELLKLINIEKSFGKKKVLNKINFNLESGEIIGYLGPNGAGKTTTLKIIMNMVQKDAGQLYVYNELIKSNNVAFRRQIGFMPENNEPFGFLTGKEYLKFISYVYKIEDENLDSKIDELMKLFLLYDVKNKLIKKYSKGMKQKLLFIASIIHNPKILILDEPFTGIEPNTAMLMKQTILEMKKNGAGIILSSHILEIVSKLCDRVILINNGFIEAQGDMSELKQKGGLEEFFNKLTSDDNIDINTKKIIEIINE